MVLDLEEEEPEEVFTPPHPPDYVQNDFQEDRAPYTRQEISTPPHAPAETSLGGNADASTYDPNENQGVVQKNVTYEITILCDWGDVLTRVRENSAQRVEVLEEVFLRLYSFLENLR